MPYSQNPKPDRGAVVSLVGGLLTIVLLVLWFAPLRSEPLTVTFTRGTVTLEDAAGNRSEVRPGQEIGKGQRVVVPETGGATLRLPDGHTVTIGDSSSVGVLRNDATLRGTGHSIELELGPGRVRVTGDGAPGTSLDLSTPTGVAGVRGTALVAEVRGGDALFSLHQGAVSVRPAEGPDATLSPGLGAVVGAAGASVLPLPATPEVLAPATGTLVSDSTTVLVWRPVEGAVAYSVEYARDAAFQEVLRRLLVAGDTTAAVPVLEEDLPAFVRVAAVSAEGLEGVPSVERVLHVRLRFARGQALQQAGQMEESIPEFQAALPNYATDPRLLKDLAWSLYTVSRFDDARARYEQALAVAPGDHEAHLELGRVLFWLEEYELAARSYRAVLDDLPDEPDALWGLGDTYRVMGREREAESLLLRALELAPDHPYAPESLRLLREGG